MRQRRRSLNFAIGFPVAAALTAGAFAPSALAQDYPVRPVTMISPAAAGNSPDVTMRVVADRLGQMWKQQMVILNRPGAGGLIAAQAAAAPGIEKDGYTLYMTQASTFTVLPITQEGKMPVDLHKAFVPIGLVGVQPIGVAVNAALPVKTLPELLDLVKKTPNGMLFGATNRGGQAHLTGELMRARTGVPLNFVHAQGAAASLNDVIAGRIPIMFEGLAGLAPGLQGGGVRLIAVASEKRLPNFPDVPTVSETVPGFQSHGWLALMAPTGTPDAIIQKVNADLKTVLQIPEVLQRFEVLGTYARIMSPAETAGFFRSEEQTWWPVVREVEKAQK
jgi:tripartite-type tricarboxylate transporter receptor subunit TctC